MSAAHHATILCRCSTHFVLSQKLIRSLFSGAGPAMPSTPGLMLTGRLRKRYALDNQLNTLTILSMGTTVEWSNSQHLNICEHTFQLVDLIAYLGLCAFTLPLSIHPHVVYFGRFAHASYQVLQHLSLFDLYISQSGKLIPLRSIPGFQPCCRKPGNTS